MIGALVLLSNVLAGAYIGWQLCAYRRDRRDAEHVCRALLRVHHCVLVDCDVETLVTYNEDEGYSEMTGYVIMPKEVYETHHGRLPA